MGDGEKEGGSEKREKTAWGWVEKKKKKKSNDGLTGDFFFLRILFIFTLPYLTLLRVKKPLQEILMVDQTTAYMQYFVLPQVSQVPRFSFFFF
jgi:hypothetical protein